MHLKPLPFKFLIFCFTLSIFSCQKEVSFENSNGTDNAGGNGGTGNGGGTSATYYYKATIGGVNYYQDVTLTNNYIAGSGLGGTDDVDFSAGINTMTPGAANTTEFTVSKGILHNYLSATDAQFKSFFKPGSYPYTTGPEFDPYQNGDGVYLYWVDKQGKIWSTVDGSGDQTGSSFKIISVEDARDATNTYYIKVKMQFNCKLYKEETGEMKELTNGEMVGLFGKI